MLACARECVAILGGLGHRGIALNRGYSMVAAAALELGHYAVAHQYARESLALAKDLGARREEGQMTIILGRLALVEGRLKQARQLLAAGYALLQETEVGDAAAALSALLCAAVRRGRQKRAHDYLRHLLEASLQAKAVLLIYHALPAAALVLGKAGRAVEAVEVEALARAQPYVANSRWFAAVFDPLLAEFTAGLPEEARAAAAARGRKREVWSVLAELYEGMSEEA
jgi:hypothetical protein